jgi:transcription initiation factor TFIIB
MMIMTPTDEDDMWCNFDNLKKGLILLLDDEFSDNDAKKNTDKLDTYCQFCDCDTDIVLDDGNYMCKTCNSLLDRHIDHGAEWRYYGNDDNKSNDPTRCGLPTNELLPNSSLGSMIGYANKESYQIRIMRKYHMWNSMTYKERSLYNIFEGLTANAVNNGISKSIIDEAKMLYKKVSEAKISRGENRSGLIASSIYIACKNNKVPRSTKEIMKLNVQSTTADDFIGRFCSKLELDNDKKTLCKVLVKKADELAIVSENTPPSVAAGGIYLCSMTYGWNISKKDLSDACDISQVTISKCYKKMVVYKSLLITDDIEALKA